jgi:hypothetical protein
MTPLLTEIDFVGQGDESDGVAQNTRNTSRRRFRRRSRRSRSGQSGAPRWCRSKSPRSRAWSRCDAPPEWGSRRELILKFIRRQRDRASLPPSPISLCSGLDRPRAVRQFPCGPRIRPGSVRCGLSERFGYRPYPYLLYEREFWKTVIRSSERYPCWRNAASANLCAAPYARSNGLSGSRFSF